MLIARRLYIYLVTYISLLTLAIGASNLLRLILETVLGLPGYEISQKNYFRDQFSLYGAVTLVGTAVWIIHWLLARRIIESAKPDAAQETNSLLRKLLIYGVLLTAVLFTTISLGQFTGVLLSSLTNLNSGNFKQSLTHSLPFALVFGITWFYFWRVRSADNNAVPENNKAATIRRWYFYLVNYWTISVLVFSLADLVRMTWQVTNPLHAQAISLNGVPVWFASDVGVLAVNLGAWFWHWRWTQNEAGTLEEQHSVLRKVYLYGFIFQAVLVTLTSLAFSFYHLLRIVVDNYFLDSTGKSLLVNAVDALVNAVVYGVFWFYHWQIIKQDAHRVAAEQPRQVAIRSLYFHLVSLISLGVLAVGLAMLVRLLADFWLGGSATIALNRERWGDEISNVVTLVLVGGLSWYLTWSGIQKRAMASADQEERQGIIRRIYLYLVLFASVVTLLGGLIWLVYRVFLIALGDTVYPGLISEISWALGASLTSGGILAYHLTLLVGDLRARAAHKLPKAKPPLVPVEITSSGAPATMPALNGLLLVQDIEPSTLDKDIRALKTSLGENKEVAVYLLDPGQAAELNAWLTDRHLQKVTAGAPEEVKVLT